MVGNTLQCAPLNFTPDIFGRHMLADSLLVLPQKHPLLNVLANEIHSRSFPMIKGSVCLSQVTLLHHGCTKEQQLKHLRKLAIRYQANQPNSDTDCYYQDLGILDIRWEYHTEFSTYTFIRFNQNEAPFQCSAWSVLPVDWCGNIPGSLISATHIDIQADLPEKSQFQKYFAGNPVATSLVSEATAQIWASFKQSEDGFDRIMVINLDLNQSQTGRLLRCLLELSSYRMMALLSLPVSKRLLPNISEMERSLANITLKLSKMQQSNQSQKLLLTQLSTLSAHLESLIADHQFRFDASEAYLELVTTRLYELKEQDVPGGPSLTEFLNRRLTPAVRTGTSIKKRMLNMSTRIEKASDLLRTKINLGLEEQNQDLFKAINRRSHIQLRLQQLVESVSMIAISYYLLQMLSYMLVLPNNWQHIITKEQAVAISVPIVFTSVWYALRKLKKRWRKEIE